MAHYLVASCRGTLAPGEAAPFRIGQSPLFVLRPWQSGDTSGSGSGGSVSTYRTYIPRLAREVDFVLALRWERDDGRRAAGLARSAAGALRALAEWPPRSATAAWEAAGEAAAAIVEEEI